MRNIYSIYRFKDGYGLVISGINKREVVQKIDNLIYWEMGEMAMLRAAIIERMRRTIVGLNW